MDDVDARRMRIAIAEDALVQIGLGRYVPGHLEYVAFESANVFERAPTAVFGPEILEGSCVACAIGSMFASMVRRDGACRNVNLTQRPSAASGVGVQGGRLIEALRDYFWADQLRLIEDAFECLDPEWDFRSVDLGNRERAKRFAARFSGADPTSHLVAILENIVRNDGAFVPEDVRAGPAAEPPKLDPAVVLRGQEAPPAAPSTAQAQVLR